jgi:hypothetical protein
MEFKLVTVTPDLAEKMLKTMGRNRGAKKLRINTMVADMKQGKWKTTPYPIVFENGVLIDGQHRLNAVIKSGCSVDFVVSEINDDIMDVIDKGVPRSVGDNFAINGVQNYNAAASITSKIMVYQSGGRSLMSSSSRGKRDTGASRGNFAISQKMVQDYYLEHSEMINKCTSYAVSLYNQSSAPLLSKSEIGFLYWLFGMDEQCENFLTSVCVGIGVMAKSPQLALRRILEDKRAKKRVVTSVDTLEYCLLAFKKFKANESCEFLKIKGNK